MAKYNTDNPVSYLRGLMNYRQMAAEVDYSPGYLKRVALGWDAMTPGLLRALYKAFPEYITFNGSPRRTNGNGNGC